MHKSVFFGDSRCLGIMILHNHQKSEVFQEIGENSLKIRAPLSCREERGAWRAR